MAGETIIVRQGLRGIKGDRGDPGPAGNDGAPGVKGDKGDPGPPSVGLTTLTSDYDQSIRQTGPRGGPYQLLFRRTRELYLNDRNDIDATGATDMASTIATYLSEFAAGPSGAKLHVYCESGSTYKVGSTIDVPAGMYLEGPLSSAQYQATATARFRASAAGVTMLRLTGRGSSLRGLQLDLNNLSGAVAVRPNSILQTIEKCRFSAGAADAWGVKGGGILYFAMRDCETTDGWTGRAVDLLKAYADVPANVYYGVNVGWFERNVMNGQGAFRASGIYTVRDGDFEGGKDVAGALGVIEIANNDAGCNAAIEDNYFEGSSGITGVYVWGGAAFHVTGNQFYLVKSAGNGTVGVKYQGYSYDALIERNLFRVETGIAYIGPTDTLHPGVRIGPNQYDCITDISGVPATSGTGNGSGNSASTLIQDPATGFRFLGAAVVGSARRVNTESTLYLHRANVWILAHSSPTTVTPQTGTLVAGQMVTLCFYTANVTLPTASWGLASGQDETPAAGVVKTFIVNTSGNLQEVGPRVKAPAVKTTTFTADTSADVYLCDATSAAFTATLPSAATWTGGPLTIKKTDSSANAVTVGTTSSQTIDGATTLVLRTSGHAVTVRPSAGNWQTVATTPGAHLTSSGSTPAIAAGTGAGTTPTVSISGADTAGTITVTTGTSPAASATVATITFTASYGTTPKSILIDPCGVNSAALTGTGRVYEDQASRTATTFALKVGSTALAASTTYLFAYQVIG